MLNAWRIIFLEDWWARSKEVALATHEVSDIALLEIVLRSNLFKYSWEIFKLCSINLVVFSLAPFYLHLRLCRCRKKIRNQRMKLFHLFRSLELTPYLCPFAPVSGTRALLFILYPFLCTGQANFCSAPRWFLMSLLLRIVPSRLLHIVLHASLPERPSQVVSPWVTRWRECKLNRRSSVCILSWSLIAIPCSTMYLATRSFRCTVIPLVCFPLEA